MINKYVKNETISPQLKTRTKQPISRCDFCNCFVVCLKCRTNNTLPQANAMNSLVQMKCFMNSLGLNSELFPFEVHFSFNDTLNFQLEYVKDDEKPQEVIKGGRNLTVLMLGIEKQFSTQTGEMQRFK